MGSRRGSSPSPRSGEESKGAAGGGRKGSSPARGGKVKGDSGTAKGSSGGGGGSGGGVKTARVRMQELSELLESQLISQDEFNTKRKEILEGI